MGVLKELHRRNVFRVGVAYVVTAWVLLQVADIIFEAISAPLWVMQGFLSLLALGFVPTMLFAWAFEVTPEGIKHQSEVDQADSITHVTGHKLDIMIIVMLVAIGAYVVIGPRDHPPAAPQELATNEVAGDPSLTGPGESAALPDDKSIAVLPFVNLSSDPEQEYFSDGISEELLNVLAQIPELRVAARTSSFQFKGDNRDISEIARLLKVNHVLEGSVRKAGTRLRITAQLIEAEGGYHLWSQTYDRELKDVFAIQDEISGAIGDALVAELELLGDQAGSSVPRVAETANTAAYEAYLKGRYLVNQRGNRAITEAERELQKAIRLDPDYAPAQAQLAIAIALLHNSPSSYGDLTTAQVNARAVPHIEAAMSLNPALAEVWGAKAMLASVNDDNEAALTYASRAVELNPVYIDALNWMNTSALLLGRYRDAQSSILRILEVDPLSIIGQLNYASNFLAETDPEEARQMAMQLAGQHKWAGYVALSNVAFSSGEIAESVEWLLRAFAEDPLDRFSNASMAATFGMLGLHAEGMRISDATRFSAQFGAGRFEEAVAQLREDTVVEPDSGYLQMALANALYFSGAFDEAAAIYQELLDEGDGSFLQGGGYSMQPTLRFAWLQRMLGKEEAYNQLLAMADADFAAKEGTRFADNVQRAVDGSMRAWLDGNRESAVDLMRKAIDMGGRSRNVGLEPLWGELADDAEFKAMIDAQMALIEIEGQKTLDMICNRNPIPDSWQPLTASCSQ
jgi:TolB-like protein